MMIKSFSILLLFVSINTFAQVNNYSIDFDGINDVVKIGEMSVHEINDNITIMGAFNLNSLNPGTNIIVNREGNYEIGIDPNTSELSWALNNTSPGWWWTSSGLVVTPNTWYQFAFTYTNGEARMYVNDSLYHTSAATGTISDYDNGSWNELWIGNRQYNNSVNHTFNGKIDEISIWNTVLDSAQIIDYFKCPPVGTESNLVGYWNFEEGSGVSTSDQSTYANDGILYNMPLWSTDITDYYCCTQNPITQQPTNQTVTIGNNATFSFIDNLTSASYQWQMDSGTGFINLTNAGQYNGTNTNTLEVNSVISNNNNTLFRCIVTESLICSDTTDVVALTVEQTGVGIFEQSQLQMKIYPNPTKDIISISFNNILFENGYSIYIENNIGQIQFHTLINQNAYTLGVDQIGGQGLYFIKIVDSDNNIVDLKKIVVY